MSLKSDSCRGDAILSPHLLGELLETQHVMADLFDSYVVRRSFQLNLQGTNNKDLIRNKVH
jgi:hypothetical protein